MITRILIYRDHAGEWRATLYAANHEAIFVSSEGYKNRQDVVDVCEINFPNVEILDKPDIPA